MPCAAAAGSALGGTTRASTGAPPSPSAEPVHTQESCRASSPAPSGAWSSSLSEAPDGTYPPASSSAPASAQEDGSSPAAFSSSASGDADGTIEPRSGSSRSPKASSPSKERSPQPASRTPEAASTPASSAVLDVGAIGGKRIGGLSGSKGSARPCGRGRGACTTPRTLARPEGPPRPGAGPVPHPGPAPGGA